MWGFIKGLCKLILQILRFIGQALTALNSGMDSVNLAMTMQHNTNNIRNRKPLDTNCIGDGLKTLAYLYGVAILVKQSDSTFLAEQHEALVEYVESLHTPPKYLDYKADVQNLIKNVYFKAQKDFVASLRETGKNPIENSRNLK